MGAATRCNLQPPGGPLLVLKTRVAAICLIFCQLAAALGEPGEWPMQSAGCAKFGCPLLISHVYGRLLSSSPHGSYFMGFKNNQIGLRKVYLFLHLHSA